MKPIHATVPAHWMAHKPGRGWLGRQREGQVCVCVRGRGRRRREVESERERVPLLILPSTVLGGTFRAADSAGSEYMIEAVSSSSSWMVWRAPRAVSVAPLTLLMSTWSFRTLWMIHYTAWPR